MTLKTLSTCAHRWRNVKLGLFDKQLVDCILPYKGKFSTLECLKIVVLGGILKHAQDLFEVAPRLKHADVGQCTKNQGWILPYAQLTELFLWNMGSLYPSRNVLDLLPMLHNVKKLRLRFHYQSDREDGLAQSAPIPLNRLLVLEVPHPAVLSWFKTPSLCDLRFVDDLQDDNNEPLDVQGQISSLIQRSGCRIRKLYFWSSRKIHVGMLNDVEELEIHSENEIRAPIDISSLPRLRFLTITDVIHRDIEPLVNFIITALQSAKVPQRNECSVGTTPNSCLERVTVELHDSHQQPKIPKRLLEIADKWPLVVFRTRLFCDLEL